MTGDQQEPSMRHNLTFLDELAAEHDLFFPPFPQSRDISTVGGTIATDASGTRTVNYGEVADWGRELEVGLADGETWQ
jgi:D-lactate dehydrogenase (cytochrome)